MNYDKNSFLAGISVGRTLKGWAAGSEGFSGGGGLSADGGIEVIPVKKIELRFQPIFLDTPMVIPVESFLVDEEG
mgnify:CR=1 FL=1